MMPYKDRDAYLRYQRAYKVHRKRELDAYKVRRGCDRCGYDAHAAALHFHHRVPDGRMGNVTYLNWRTTPELPKCDLLCANCHEVEHAR